MRYESCGNKLDGCEILPSMVTGQQIHLRYYYTFKKSP